VNPVLKSQQGIAVVTVLVNRYKTATFVPCINPNGNLSKESLSEKHFPEGFAAEVRQLDGE